MNRPTFRPPLSRRTFLTRTLAASLLPASIATRTQAQQARDPIGDLSELPPNEWRRIAPFEGGGEVGWTYDAANQLFIKYGGCCDNGEFAWTDKQGRQRNSCGYSNRLLAFDPARCQWSEKVAFDPSWPKDRPPNGCTRAHTYDPVEKKVWLFGGNASYGGGDFKQLWQYDTAESQFTPVAAENKKSLQIGSNTCQMALDWKNRILVVLWRHGHYATFDLKTGKWTNRHGPFDLQFSTYAPIVYEPESGKIIHLAKRRLTSPQKERGEPSDKGLWYKYRDGWSLYSMETWLYDAGRDEWTAARPDQEPPPRWRFGLAHDPDRQVVMMLGGSGGVWDKDERYFTDTWLYRPEKNRWLQLRPKTNIQLGQWATRNFMPLGYDPVHRAYVAAIEASGTWAFRLPKDLSWDD